MTDQQTVIGLRLANVEEQIRAMNEAVQILTKLAQKHEQHSEALGRAFSEIDKHEVRLRHIEGDYVKRYECNETIKAMDARVVPLEMQMPVSKLITGYIVAGIAALIGLLGMYVLNSIFK